MKKTRLFALLLSFVLLLSTVASPAVYAQAASIAVPTGLKATVLGSSSIKLTWTATSGAKNYQVYGGTSTSAMSLKATTTAATGTLTALTPSTTYYYKVRAIPTTGSAGAFSAAVSAKTTAGIAAPTGVKAVSASSAQINLSWAAVTGATSYTVYRCATATGAFAKITTTTAKAYNNTGLAANTAYYYKIRAVNAKGEGLYSAAVTARTRPAVPTGLAATALSSSSIKLTWKAVAGATKYVVYRSGSSAGTFTKIADAAAAAAPAYTSSGLAANTSYYYKVSAVNAGGEGAKTAAVTAKTKPVTVPGTPAGLKAYAVNGNSIQLTWTAVSGATKYTVYRAASASGTFAKVTDVTTPSYKNTGLAANTSYYYKVSASNAAGEGAKSATAAAKTFGSLATPTNFTTATYNFQSVWLKFSPVQNAATYRVYYSKTASADISAYAHFDYASTDFRAVGLDANTTYYFRVAAVNTSGVAGTPTGFLAGKTANAPGTPSQPKFKLNGIAWAGTKYRMYFYRDPSVLYQNLNDPEFDLYTGTTSSNLTYRATCDLSYATENGIDYSFYCDVNPGEGLWYGFTANYGIYSSSMQKVAIAALGNPTSVTANGNLTGGILYLNWSSVYAAARYHVYKCVAPPDPTKTWAEFKASATAAGHLSMILDTTAISASLTGFPNFSTGYIIVVPASSTGVEGAFVKYAQYNMYS